MSMGHPAFSFPCRGDLWPSDFSGTSRILEEEKKKSHDAAAAASFRRS